MLYVYPRTGSPGKLPFPGWDDVPGARGCTPQSCGFRDHAAELGELGASRIAGVSTQTLDAQIEFAERNHMPFPVIADPELVLRDLLRLPTFEIQGHTLYKRLALVAGRRLDREGLLSGFPARPERAGRGRLAAGYRGRMNLDAVAGLLEQEPSYRTRQVWEWAARGATLVRAR